jgi:ATP-dependent 26S proteasome regulatory subunit
MNPLQKTATKSELPESVVPEAPGFIPRMVMTDEIKVVAREVIHQWKRRKDFAGLLKYGIRPLDRLLFHGPPGNGKTMACYWIAAQLGVPVYRVLCNALHGSGLGETPKAVADVMDFFNRRMEPAITLWDEAEAIFMDRSKAEQACDREIGRATTIFMQALDRWKSPTLIVMATNLPDQLDAAVLSRVEMRLEFPGPTEEQCWKLLEYWSELLCDHGSSEWGPQVAERIKVRTPLSFRELQQLIAFSAREWTARRCAPR